MYASVEEEVIDHEEVLQRVGPEPCPTDPTRSPEGGLVGRSRQGGSPRSSGNGVPAHLQDLLDRGAAHLGGEERARLASSLVEFQGAFTGLDGRLGQTKWVQHTINTGTTPPIRQPPRRLPIHKRLEAQRQVDQMLADGVIEPSHRPWSSPVVLVR